MKKISYYFNKFPNLMYFLVPCTIIFILGISLGSVEGLDKQRAKSFIGGSPNTIINRIGSLSIGSLVPATWLSDNTSSDFRKSCINKWTTSRASDRGIETCLDIRGGAAFDALFVNQPAYLIGKVVLNNTFINADPSGLVIGTEGHSGNSILVSGLGRFNGNTPAVRDVSTLRYLCASGTGEFFACTQGPLEVEYQWVVEGCTLKCQDVFGNQAPGLSSCSEIPLDLPQSCYQWHEVGDWSFCQSNNTQTQSVHCDVVTGVHDVGDQYCPPPKPSTQRACTYHYWNIGQYGLCQSDTQRYRSVQCSTTNPIASNVGDNQCIINGAGPKPATSQGCTYHYWYEGPWGSCQSGDIMFREIDCRSLNPNASDVDDSLCLARHGASSKPSETGSCEYKTYSWYTGNWGTCQSNGTQGRVVRCDELRVTANVVNPGVNEGLCGPQPRPSDNQGCDYYYWEKSAWGSCQSDFTEYRNIQCKRVNNNTTYNEFTTSRCPADGDLGTSRYCEYETYNWWQSGFGPCQSNSQQFQTVQCRGTRSGTVGDDKCVNDKPAESRACTYYTYDWDTGDWGTCNDAVAASCSGSYVVNVGGYCGNGTYADNNSSSGSCSGFYTSGGKCKMRTWGEFQDVSVAQAQCSSRGDAYACDSGYNCNDTFECQENSNCTDLSASQCGVPKNSFNNNACEWRVTSASCSGFNDNRNSCLNRPGECTWAGVSQCSAKTNVSTCNGQSPCGWTYETESRNCSTNNEQSACSSAHTNCQWNNAVAGTQTRSVRCVQSPGGTWVGWGNCSGNAPEGSRSC